MRSALFLTLLTATASFAQQPPTPPPHGTIVFERGATSPQSDAATPHSDPGLKSDVTDAIRSSVFIASYSLDVRLEPGKHAIAVRALLTVRNNGDMTLTQLPLQLSSTLNWEDIRLSSNSALTHLRFAQNTLASDADHTGKINEAAAVLPHPLAPGSEVHLDVIYSGVIPRSSARLESIGTPADIAQASDWDEISPAFTALRGFGYVLWYPVSSVPVRLGDGDKLFTEIGRAKLLESRATMTVRVTDEAPAPAPNIAILNGTVTPLSITAGTEQATVPTLVKTSLDSQPVGFETPSLVLTSRHKTSGVGVDVYARDDNPNSAASYLSASTMLAPLFKTWLGEEPKRSLAIVDLPDADDAPAEQGASLLTPLQPLDASQLTYALSHSLAHGRFTSPRAWLNEGVASFMSTLWTEQSRSRAAALAQLDAQRGALAIVEPGADDAHPSRPGLLDASQAIFYRTKATYVLWMLRSFVGDDALQAVLRAYDPAADTRDDYFEQLVLKRAPYLPNDRTAADLHQFFEDWVYHDKGLPDLTITSVVPSRASVANTYLVAVNVANAGPVGADVPVTVVSGTTQVTERMFIPARASASRRIIIQDEPIRIQVNDGIVPETQASEHVQQIHYTAPVTP